jgi:hypothetical protein
LYQRLAGRHKLVRRYGESVDRTLDGGMDVDACEDRLGGIDGCLRLGYLGLLCGEVIGGVTRVLARLNLEDLGFCGARATSLADAAPLVSRF